MPIISSHNEMTILVVDESVEDIDFLSEVLCTEYRVITASNGPKALQMAQTLPKPNLILLDINIPKIDGVELCQLLNNNPVTVQTPVILMTSKMENIDEEAGFAIGVVDYISKPVSPVIVKARIKTHLALYNHQRQLEREVQQRTLRLEKNQLEVIRCLGRAAEYKDHETGFHVVRMTWYSRILAEATGANTSWCNLLFDAAPMHDIGKIGIADHILCKPGKLNAQEWHDMKKHVEIGVKILGSEVSPLLTLAREVAISHHEKWDGSGYPNGYRGEQIPLSGRITAIADVFDALVSVRPYKKAWTVEQACDLLTSEAGKHFDPELVPLFINALPKILEVKESFAEH